MSFKMKLSKYNYIIKIIVSLLLLISIYYLYVSWPKIIHQSTLWQREFHLILSNSLRQIKYSPTQAGSSLLVISFVYGLVHAAGPGHGKIVITTYIATHRQRLKKSLLLTLCASLLQAVVAIILVSTVLGLLKLTTEYLHLSAQWLEKLSFLMIALFGVMMIVRAIKTLLTHHKTNSSIQIRQIRPLNIEINNGMKRQLKIEHNCACCGHKHTLSDEELQKNWSSILFVVITMGIRPCSGAIFILLFASLLNVYGWGILATFAMAIGTAITISLIAMMVHFIRRSTFKLFAQSSITYTIGPLLLLLGGGLLAIVGIIMYQSIGDSSQLFFQR